VAEQERRKFQRLQLRLPISGLSGQARAGELWTRDISPAGMLFHVAAGYAPQDGAIVSFELTVPPGEGYATCESKVRGAGRVVRKSPCDGQNTAVAIRFDRPLAISLPA